ncbi:MAG: EscU/YscU/HrcU family type III secretion system export apparatus switch protein [Alphaproteobacteria bacterium]|nr:EscU/YscU/HrcU family type III secretion system export apparatus switch protein [Alphaproteobacteria bacterium]MBP7758400.1 EscU/YscU/HrcU family type III secretion system export apparatus switch protein [Alphaproteobacteria bacterium]MBP7762395.1 EscU/YscU/HrcU family type III secretion system export apparatus switch protein [Alphaproteobacteria bacterium]MBP7903918.1 EscU/YscU/HrcU family type III secretion system export apparatus switch protein [Alphaproteobacteria bacterium]
MTDLYDDGSDPAGEHPLKPLNSREIPKDKTAVALKESMGGKKVPRIAAAGRGTIAERILQLAYENGIYVREDGDLAQLLAKIELDSPIPSETFPAVGEILSYVYRANGQPDPFDTERNFSKNGE